jgi:hypothetical protein
MYRLLLSIVLVLVCASRVSGVPFESFPSDVQRILNTIYGQLPSDARTLGNNSIRALTPEQAQQAVITIRSGVATLGLSGYTSMAVTLDQIRRTVSQRFQQAFVNGVWGVSPQEEQYAAAVIQVACLQTGAPRERCGLSGGGPTAQGQFSAPSGGFHPPLREDPCYRCREDNVTRALGGNRVEDCTRACAR